MAERAQANEKDPTSQKDFEALYLRYECVGQQAKARYEKIYKEMVSKLSVSHLEPFAEILKQYENCNLSRELIVDELQQQLMTRLQCGLDAFWTEYEVTSRLAQLELLKEKFKECRINWNINRKKPEERTLPIRMLFKDMRVRHLKKQLQYQEKQLQELYQINAGHRTRLQEIEGERIYLKAHMDRQRTNYHKYITTFRELEAKHLPTTIVCDGGPAAHSDVSKTD